MIGSLAAENLGDARAEPLVGSGSMVATAAVGKVIPAHRVESMTPPAGHAALPP